jgi:hypothetical protein
MFNTKWTTGPIPQHTRKPIFGYVPSKVRGGHDPFVLGGPEVCVRRKLGTPYNDFNGLINVMDIPISILLVINVLSPIPHNFTQCVSVQGHQFPKNIDHIRVVRDCHVFHG